MLNRQYILLVDLVTVVKENSDVKRRPTSFIDYVMFGGREKMLLSSTTNA